MSDRRSFLQNAGAGAAAVALSGSSVAAGTADQLGVGIIGTGGMGSGHTRHLASRTDVQIRWLCDVDAKRLASNKEVVEKAGGKPDTTSDLRHVLDDKSVDAVLAPRPITGIHRRPSLHSTPANMFMWKNHVAITSGKAA